MNVVAWIVGIALAGVFAFAGLTKVLDFDRMRENFGYSKRQYQAIGLSEVAGAAGVIVGLAWSKWEWIGHAAAVGIICLMLGAMMAHARVEDDGKKVVPAIVMSVVAVVFIIFLSLR